VSELPIPDIEALAEAIVFAHDPLDETQAGAVAADSPLSRELAATAALVTAATVMSERPPERLRTRLAADALAFCAATRGPLADQQTADGPLLDGNGDGRFVAVTTSQRPPVVAFLFGAAAALLLVWLFADALSPNDNDATDPAAVRAQVLAELANGADRPVVHESWKPGPSELRGDIVGDVVWRQDRQDGWLTFRGLPKLADDKAYQLWIVDGERAGAPVDGGVFTIADQGAETVVPIHAKLRVAKPAAFVITVEDRDGVVVSKQEHVVAIASL